MSEPGTRSKPLCPRCGGALTRIHRTVLERIFKIWRVGWHKMECDVCYHAFWVRARDND